MILRRICSSVGVTTVVVMRAWERGERATAPREPSLVRSLGDEEGGEGVTTGEEGRRAAARLRRARCTRIMRFIAVFSVEEDEEGDGDELREGTKIGVDGRDMS